MKTRIRRILEGYGSDMKLIRADGAKTVRAFLQPVTAKSWEAMRRTIETLGEVPATRYVYIGPPDETIKEDDEVEFREERYRVCRAETLTLAGQALYSWGLLKKEGGEDPWTS